MLAGRLVHNLGCFNAPERAADAAIMDDNGLLTINNRITRNSLFIIRIVLYVCASKSLSTIYQRSDKFIIVATNIVAHSVVYHFIYQSCLPKHNEILILKII